MRYFTIALTLAAVSLATLLAVLYGGGTVGSYLLQIVGYSESWQVDFVADTVPDIWTAYPSETARFLACTVLIPAILALIVDRAVARELDA